MKKTKIVFLGSEGSGKSTLIRYVKKELDKKRIDSEVFFMGWKNFHNPILKFASKTYLKDREKTENKLKRYRERSILFYFVYYSELWIRYLKILLCNKDFILMDRYFYDELAFAKGLKLK